MMLDLAWEFDPVAELALLDEMGLLDLGEGDGQFYECTGRDDSYCEGYGEWAS